MKINFDLRYSLGHGGISNFIRNIAKELDNSTIDYHGCNFWYHGRTLEKYSWFKGPLHQSIFPDRIINEFKLILPFSYEMLVGSTADVNLFLTYRLPRVNFKKPVISTIHDIILIKAQSESHQVLEEHRRILERSVSISDHILTVSEASKRDLIDYFKINPDCISIVHNGIDFSHLSSPIKEEEKNNIRLKYSLPSNYILNFGECRNHKNIERLIKAYACLPRSIREVYKLVLTKSNKKIDQLCKDLKIESDINIIGFVDECDKKIIYHEADLVFYASLYEGFGVPVIEAQACSTPVLTSNTSSLPEASGGAAIFVDPYSIEEIRDGIIRLIEDSTLRNRLISLGLQNASKYTWKQSVKELEQVLLEKKW